MRVVVLRNAIAGRGTGRGAVESLLLALDRAGHRIAPVDVQRGPAGSGELAASLRDADVLVVAGGDGTLHHSAPLAMAAGVAVYHFPLGTENLFARQFGMTRDPAAVVRALASRRIATVDAAQCSGRHFLLMGSVGFDSCVVERVAAARSGGISRMTYVSHFGRELLNPRFTPLTVEADGAPLADGRPGIAIVANSRQYAARLDPARIASMTDGLLDVIFLPAGSRLGLLRRLAQVASGRHMRDAGVVRMQAREISVGAAGQLPFQLDGEHAGRLLPGVPLRISVRPGALRVLQP